MLFFDLMTRFDAFIRLFMKKVIALSAYNNQNSPYKKHRVLCEFFANLAFNSQRP